MPPNTTLSCLTVPALRKHTATVIFAHGLGESGHVWKPVAQLLQADPALQHVKWIFPHAPRHLVSGSYKVTSIPSWFDAKTDNGILSALNIEAELHMLQNADAFNELVDTEIAQSGLTPDRILLGGFGQGCVVALHAGLTSKTRLGGVVVLSGTFLLKYQLKDDLSPHAKQLPIFWSYGSAEPAATVASSREGVDFLESLGFTVTRNSTSDIAPVNLIKTQGISFYVYPGLGHASETAEVDGIKAWLKNVCSDLPSQRL